MTDPEKPPSERPPETGKLILAILLLCVAGYLAATKYVTTSVDWYLGDIRRDPTDMNARQGIARLGERAIPRLEQELKSTDDNARLVAVLALSAIDGESADRMLAGAIKDPDALTAANAVDACGRRRSGPTDRAILEAIDGKSPMVRLAGRRAFDRRFDLPWWALGRG